MSGVISQSVVLAETVSKTGVSELPESTRIASGIAPFSSSVHAALALVVKKTETKNKPNRIVNLFLFNVFLLDSSYC